MLRTVKTTWKIVSLLALTVALASCGSKDGGSSGSGYGYGYGGYGPYSGGSYASAATVTAGQGQSNSLKALISLAIDSASGPLPPGTVYPGGPVVARGQITINSPVVCSTYPGGYIYPGNYGIQPVAPGQFDSSTQTAANLVVQAVGPSSMQIIINQAMFNGRFSLDAQMSGTLTVQSVNGIPCSNGTGINQFFFGF